jgi:hypothetical protein
MATLVAYWVLAGDVAALWVWAAFAPRPLEAIGLEHLANPFALRQAEAAFDLLIGLALPVLGLLTAVLGLGYAGAVLLLGHLFGGVASNPPSWVVAGATLAVAALFQPARRRVQQVVDRRFNRRRYDAAKTIEGFSVRLRHQVDLDTLTGELLALVDQTVEPTRATLWLRPTGDATSPQPRQVDR